MICLLLCGAAAGRAIAAEPTWDREAARQHLDGRINDWLSWSKTDKNEGTRCISCHTAVPMTLARLTLAPEVSPPGQPPNAEKKMIKNITARVDNWGKIDSWTGPARRDE
jgi:squalene-hopene/tetraprenyl-beta-curcumene cyclase